MNQESLHLMMLAATRYASSRSSQDRAIMFSVGKDFWNDFPAFLAEMKEAIQAGRSGDFLRPGEVKHMYALLFMGIVNGLDADHLDRVGGALFAAASASGPRVPGKARAAAGNRAMPTNSSARANGASWWRRTIA